jgi:hypothetical protein
MAKKWVARGRVFVENKVYEVGQELKGVEKKVLDALKQNGTAVEVDGELPTPAGQEPTVTRTDANKPVPQDVPKAEEPAPPADDKK